MKKINILMLLICSTAFWGCEKFLDEKPKSFLSPTTFFHSEKNIQIALNGVYDALGNRGVGAGLIFGNYNQGLFSMGEVGTDQMKASADIASNRFHELDLYTYTASSEIPSDVWRVHYIGINRANTVINRATPLLGNPNFNDTTTNRAIAEAKFLRAFYYFNLVRFYGAVPLKLTETASLTAGDVVSLPRSPVLDVYKQIETDLLVAKDYLLMPSELNAKDNGRATKTAAWALLARVYNTWASYPLKDVSKWALGASYAKKVIDSHQHSLLTDFSQIFVKQNEGNKEIIFAVKFSDVVGENSSLGGHNGVIGAGANGFTQDNPASFGIVVMEKAFYNSYKANDQRRDWTCSAYRVNKNGVHVPLTPADSSRFIGMAKFRRDGYLGFASPYDYPLIRYADVLTMYAEATAMESGAPTAASYNALNQVRRRAFNVPINTLNPAIDYANLSPIGFIDAVLKERSWELVSEDCSRWHDLVRTERLGQVVAATKRAVVLSNFKESKNKLFPIPLIEMDSNPAMVGQQNPGY